MHRRTDPLQLYYHYLQEPVFHQVAFGILTLSIVVHSIYVMENKIRPYLQQKYSRSKAHLSSTKPLDNPVTPERDQEFMSAMWAMVCKGLSIFLLGWMLWALDTAYCSTLRHWRRQMGLPWGIVLEGHGWWHIFTGAGSYYYITWGIWLRRCLNHQEEEYTLEWEGILTSLPEVVPVSSIPEKGHLSNGGHNDKITRNKVADLKLS